MAERLTSLRVEAALDSSAYVAGARNKVAADEAMKASADRVGQAVQDTARHLAPTGAALDRLRASIDPTVRGMQQFERGAGTLDSALSKGLVSQNEHARLMDLLRTRYLSFGPAATEASGHIEGFREVLRGATDVMVGNFAGATRAGALLANTFGLLRFAANPVGAAMIAVGAGLAVGAIHAEAMEGETRRLGVALQGMGENAGITAGQLRELAGSLGAEGVPRADAIGGLSSLARSGAFSGSQVPSIANLAADVSAGAGTSYGDAITKLTDAATRGLPAIRQLDQAWNFLTSDELKNIATMAEHGDQAGALSIAIEALHRRFDGDAKNSLTGFDGAVQKVKGAWGELLDKFADWAPVQKVVDLLTSGAQGIANLLPSPSIPLRGGAGLIGGPPGTVSQQGLDPFGRTPSQVQAQQKQVETLVAAYADENKALAASLGVREQVRAAVEADTYVRENNLAGLEAENAKRAIVTNALLKQTTAIRDFAAEAGLEVTLAAQVADAYTTGSTKMLQADAARLASLDHLKNALVDVGQRTQEYVDKSAADIVLRAAPEVDRYRQAAIAEEALAGATRNSITAAHAAEVENRVLAATYDLRRVASSNAADALKRAAGAEADSIGDSIRAQDAAQTSAAIEREISLRKEDIGIEQQLLAVGYADKGLRAETLTLLQAQLELKRQFPGASDDEIAKLAQENQQYAQLVGQVRAQKEEQQQLNASIKAFGDEVGSAFEKYFTGAGNSHKKMQELEQTLTSILEKQLIFKPLESGFDSLLTGQPAQNTGIYSLLTKAFSGGGAGSTGGLIGWLFGNSASTTAAAAAQAGATGASGGGLLSALWGSSAPNASTVNGASSGGGLFGWLFGSGASAASTLANAVINIANATINAGASGAASALGGGSSGGGGLFGSLGSWIGSLFGSSGGGTAPISGVGADGIAGGVFALGAAFDRGIKRFGAGDIFGSPTLFNIGMMGEAGPESIMPLVRMSSGRLGVSASGSGGPMNYFHIDASNSSDAKMTEALVEQVMARHLPGAMRVAASSAVTATFGLMRQGGRAAQISGARRK
jgi:hypothetical protein